MLTKRTGLFGLAAIALVILLGFLEQLRPSVHTDAFVGVVSFSFLCFTIWFMKSLRDGRR